MRRDRPLLPEAYLSMALAALVAGGLILAAVLFARAWVQAHPEAPEKPQPRTCYVQPIRGGGGMVTFCEPGGRP